MNLYRLPFTSRRLAIGLTEARDAALHFGGLEFGTNLRVDHFHRGVHQGHMDLGSGLVTNVGVMSMANEGNWATGFGTLRLAKNHATGTGTNAALATDIKLQTASTVGGQTPVAGTQVLVSAANLQKYQTVASISYTNTEAVTEWGLFLSSTLPSGALSSSSGTPVVSATATTLTPTGTPYTASTSSVQGQQQSIVEDTTATVYGMVTSNTTSVLTVPAWYKVSDGTAGATPSGADSFVLRPVMLDHKVFAALNVVSGDALQFTYTLTLSSGG